MPSSRDDAARPVEATSVPGTPRQVAQRHYDPDEDDELVTVVAFAIADARDVNPTDLATPLFKVVDLPSLESSLFGANARRNLIQPAPVGFRYEDLHVTVNGDGWVQVFE